MKSIRDAKADVLFEAPIVRKIMESSVWHVDFVRFLSARKKILTFTVQLKQPLLSGASSCLCRQLLRRRYSFVGYSDGKQAPPLTLRHLKRIIRDGVAWTSAIGDETNDRLSAVHKFSSSNCILPRCFRCCNSKFSYSFSAKSTIERIATPVGPFASHGRPSSTQHVAAMSR
jgi:hypothetical protein